MCAFADKSDVTYHRYLYSSSQAFLDNPVGSRLFCSPPNFRLQLISRAAIKRGLSNIVLSFQKNELTVIICFFLKTRVIRNNGISRRKGRLSCLEILSLVIGIASYHLAKVNRQKRAPF